MRIVNHVSKKSNHVNKKSNHVNANSNHVNILFNHVNFLLNQVKKKSMVPLPEVNKYLPGLINIKPGNPDI